MNSPKHREGTCAICGEHRKLSFEHVPPQSAFNNKPIFIQTYDHLLNKNSFLFGKKSKAIRGFGRYTLCESCNNNTGDWYARDFKDFAHQGMTIIENLEKPQQVVHGTYNIKPLNVLKQILAMFMSADSSGHLRSNKDLVNFILQRETVGLPPKFKVYIYSTLNQRTKECWDIVLYSSLT
jgi:hypothetical protein